MILDPTPAVAVNPKLSTKLNHKINADKEFLRHLNVRVKRSPTHPIGHRFSSPSDHWIHRQVWRVMLGYVVLVLLL